MTCLYNMILEIQSVSLTPIKKKEMFFLLAGHELVKEARNEVLVR